MRQEQSDLSILRNFSIVSYDNIRIVRHGVKSTVYCVSCHRIKTFKGSARNFGGSCDSETQFTKYGTSTNSWFGVGNLDVADKISSRFLKLSSRHEVWSKELELVHGRPVVDHRNSSKGH